MTKEPITTAAAFMAANVTDPVTRIGTRPDGTAFYRLASGALVELTKTEEEILARHTFSPNISETFGTFSPKLKLRAGDREVLRQLFYKGPTWDGDLVSKIGRDGLVQEALAYRIDGWQTLTYDGFRYALFLGMGEDKEAWENQRRLSDQSDMSGKSG